MISETLRKARDYEAQYAPYVTGSERPLFHVTGGIGWINDPNGFSVYKGEYHLFYQYYPYKPVWGPMHWGHVKTRDFIRWERLPVALAPDMPYDKDGCFSGSAIELPDGRQLLMYTGVREEQQEDGSLKSCQTQCLAVGDGVNYEKIEANPVLTAKDLPKGGSSEDFRDPKIWREDDGYYAAVGNRPADGSGSILLFRSEDGFHWKYYGCAASNHSQYGMMWECPDYFKLQGKSGENAALANILNGNLAGAENALKNATGDVASYLKAIVAARKGDANTVRNLLEKISDKALKARAADDIEFLKLLQ